MNNSIIDEYSITFSDVEKTIVKIMSKPYKEASYVIQEYRWAAEYAYSNPCFEISLEPTLPGESLYLKSMSCLLQK